MWWCWCSDCLYFCQEIRCSLVSNMRLNSVCLWHYHFWGYAIAQTDNCILLWKDTGAGFFHIALVIIILSPFFCTSHSLFPEVCGSPDQAAHYHILVQKSVSNILRSTSKHIVHTAQAVMTSQCLKFSSWTVEQMYGYFNSLLDLSVVTILCSGCANLRTDEQASMTVGIAEFKWNVVTCSEIWLKLNTSDGHFILTATWVSACTLIINHCTYIAKEL